MEYYRFKEKNGCAYTIDWFTLEFHLLLSLAQWEELEEAVKSLGEKSKDYSSKSGTKMKGKYHHYRAYQIGGLHVQFYEDAPFFDLNFNPNTVHLANDDTAVKCLQWLLSYLRASVALYNVRIRRVDYTFDVSCEYDSLYVYSRKNESHYKSTRYYGDAKSTGRLRVYDKTLERLQKAKEILDKQITRCEWIQRNEKPFTYDSIGIMDFSGLSGAVSLLSLVPPENLNEAMRRLNPKTRKKVKEKCFKPLDIDTSLFERLMDEYTEEYALADLRLVALQNRADSAFVWSDGQDFDEDVSEEDFILPDEDMETE